jgi:DNA polymerase III subunit epsilon
MERQIVLDTETTGMNRVGVRHESHGIVEIGAVEIVNRRLTTRYFHLYLRPNRPIDPAAIAVHGITDVFLSDKPPFADVVDEFCAFIRGAALIIHNAPFDTGFIDYEFSQCSGGTLQLAQLCPEVIDTLALARQRFPGKRNSLDALCSRYQIDLQRRSLHGALLDAQLLAELYLVMTGGQTALCFESESPVVSTREAAGSLVAQRDKPLHLLRATEAELQAHRDRLVVVQQQGGHCLWSTE